VRRSTRLCTLLVVLLLIPGVLFSQDPSPSPTASPAEEAAQVPTFEAAVELVTVDVVVTDKKRNPISGLTKTDFVIEEDGKPQRIASFEAVALPLEPPDLPAPERRRVSTNVREGIEADKERTFVVVFDDLNLTPFHAHRAKAAAAEFLKSAVRNGDRVSLVSTGGEAWWTTRMPEGRQELVDMLKRLEGRRYPDSAPDRISDYEAMRVHVYNDPEVTARVSRRFETYGAGSNQVRQDEMSALYGEGDPFVRARASDVYYQAATRNRLTLSLIDRLLKALGDVKGRKAMVLISAGFIYDPNLSEFKEVVESSRRSSVAIYFLDTRGLSGIPEYFSAEFGQPMDTRDVGFAFLDAQEAAHGSETLANDSGGFVVKNTNDLTRGVQGIAAESRIYYLLGYNPANTTRDGKFRKIKVKVRKKGVKVRARKGYFAPLPDGTTPEPKEDSNDPDIQRALDSPWEDPDVPIRMTSYVFDEKLLGKANVLVAFDVDVREFDFREQDGRFADTLEFLLVVAHRESGEFYRYDQSVTMNLRPETRARLDGTWFPMMRDFELAEGGYMAKVVVRDKNSQEIGTLTHRFEVPKLGAFRTSTPVLSDTLQTAPDNDGRPRPAVLARRVFSAGDMVYCSYEVYGAGRDEQTGMPKVLAGFEVRRSDGSLQTRAAPREILPTSLGGLSRMVGSTLDGAGPGEYELVLKLEDAVTGDSLEVREPFELVEPPSSSGS